jgi:hypothetical protein
MEVALGERLLKKNLTGLLLGQMIKKVVVNEKRLRRDLPIDKSFIVAGQHEYQKEQKRLLGLLNRFSKGG